ncbi:PAS domain-containing sensor histidine kinase [Desulfolucanica intricata]|uniref:PAS domain-containing sensor histidine kinase n=1 Tax=Desulfolucanica intricata TaxID=1285191 RepID=UPI00082C8819|nr:PAS domain-containing sensor histidine kinase [Desulfolucanica intricata]
MKDEDKTKEQLIAELIELRKQVINIDSNSLKFLFGKIEIGHTQLKYILDTVPCGISIATNLSCEEIMHNYYASKFWGINPWENFSYSSNNPPSVKILSNGKELLPEEMPIQRSAWYGEEITDQEIEFMWNNGVRKTSIWNSRPLYDNTGNIVGAIAAFRDITSLKMINTQLQLEITERELAEKALCTAHKMLLDIIEFLPDATFVINREQKVIAWNKAIEEMTGVRKEDIIGKGDYIYAIPFYGEPRPVLINLILSDDKETELKYKNFERKESILYADTYSPSAFEGRGAFLWGKASPLYSSDGSIVGAIQSINDITERKKMEDELKKHRNHLEEIIKERTDKLISTNEQLILEIAERKQAEYELRKSKQEKELILSTISEPVVYHDKYMQIIWANDAASKWMGIFPEKLVGYNCYKILFQKNSPCPGCPVINALKSGRIQEEEIVTPDGKTLIIRAHPVIDDNHNVLGVVEVILDISRHKQLEQEVARLDRLNLVGEMAAGIGHEIRNPMTTVRGFLQLLEGKSENIKYKEYYNLMIEELDRANAIITEFLSLAKNKPVNLKKQNLNRIVEAINPLIQANAVHEDKYVKLELNNVPDLLLDEQEIRQLILNLSRNGIEAMSPKGELIIKTFMDDDKVVLAVQDQGSGIQPDVLKKLGTPFVTTKDNGTGLGLSICYSIANRHNAVIDIETGSTGTTFYVRFRSDCLND